jgi:DNA damage-inducible protein 1
MLYLDVEIDGHKVKAMVDSGAQATVMTPACAEACGIMRLVDKRFSGIARGVGTANIIGRVHLYQIKIGNLHLPCSFTVMEGKAVDLLLGLDMLKRHQAIIDLAKDSLIIQGEEIPFLGEADIPKELEIAEQEPTLPGPAGTTIGQRSGAVMEPGAGAGAGPSGQPAPAPAAPQASVPPRATPQREAGTPAGASGAGFPEDDINKLIQLGFSRENAINALQATDGNVELAAGLLFGA